MSSRTYNTEIRKPWNPVIKKCLDAIDEHVRQNIESGDKFHIKQAEILRKYVSELKTWIYTQEKNEI